MSCDGMGPRIVVFGSTGLDAAGCSTSLTMGCGGDMRSGSGGFDVILSSSTSSLGPSRAARILSSRSLDIGVNGFAPVALPSAFPFDVFAFSRCSPRVAMLWERAFLSAGPVLLRPVRLRSMGSLSPRLLALQAGLDSPGAPRSTRSSVGAEAFFFLSLPAFFLKNAILPHSYPITIITIYHLPSQTVNFKQRLLDGGNPRETAWTILRPQCIIFLR